MRVFCQQVHVFSLRAFLLTLVVFREYCWEHSLSVCPKGMSWSQPLRPFYMLLVVVCLMVTEDSEIIIQHANLASFIIVYKSSHRNNRFYLLHKVTRGKTPS